MESFFFINIIYSIILLLQAKKDMFRKMIASLIGKETAKLHKKEIVIKNLPNLPSKVKAKTPSLDEQTRNGEDTGLASLFGH